MYRLAFRFVVAFEFVVRYNAQVQLGFFVGVLVGGLKLSFVDAGLISFLQPVLTLFMVDRLGRFLSVIYARGPPLLIRSLGLEHVGWSATFWLVLIRFVGAVT